MARICLEICVDEAVGITAAVQGGADRIELCAALALGGLTPSVGVMALASEAGVATMVMIRPRAGDFVWSQAEVRAMQAEIAATRAAGLAGVVIGASRGDGRLDTGVLAELMAAARGMDVTLHRAIDLVPDIDEAMAQCRALGIGRVLSSGGAVTAEAGLARLAQMARSGITVMPGGGVSAQNAARFAAAFDLREIHASASVAKPEAQDAKVRAFGFQPEGARATDVDRVRALRRALDQIGAPPLG